MIYGACEHLTTCEELRPQIRPKPDRAGFKKNGRIPGLEFGASLKKNTLEGQKRQTVTRLNGFWKHSITLVELWNDFLNDWRSTQNPNRTDSQKEINTDSDRM